MPISQMIFGVITTFILAWFAGAMTAVFYNLWVREVINRLPAFTLRLIPIFLLLILMGSGGHWEETPLVLSGCSVPERDCVPAIDGLNKRIGVDDEEP